MFSSHIKKRMILEIRYMKPKPLVHLYTIYIYLFIYQKNCRQKLKIVQVKQKLISYSFIQIFTKYSLHDRT